MSIYVDELKRWPDETWCHMMTDGDLSELHNMADRLGLQRRWFQNDARHPHYDLRSPKRVLAVRYGAVEVTSVEMLRRCGMIGAAQMSRSTRSDSEGTGGTDGQV